MIERPAKAPKLLQSTQTTTPVDTRLKSLPEPRLLQETCIVSAQQQQQQLLLYAGDLREGKRVINHQHSSQRDARKRASSFWNDLLIAELIGCKMHFLHSKCTFPVSLFPLCCRWQLLLIQTVNMEQNPRKKAANPSKTLCSTPVAQAEAAIYCMEHYNKPTVKAFNLLLTSKWVSTCQNFTVHLVKCTDSQ